MSNDKSFVKGLFAKKKNFPNGGSLLSNYVPNVDEFCAWLQANKKQDDSIAWNTQGSREPRLDDKGNEKLNCSLDTWEPQGGGQVQQAPQQQGYAQNMQPPQQPVYQQPQAPQQQFAPGGNPVPQNPTQMPQQPNMPMN